MYQTLVTLHPKIRLQHLVERDLFPFSTDHGMDVGAIGAIPKPRGDLREFIGMLMAIESDYLRRFLPNHVVLPTFAD